MRKDFMHHAVVVCWMQILQWYAASRLQV